MYIFGTNGELICYSPRYQELKDLKEIKIGVPHTNIQQNE